MRPVLNSELKGSTALSTKEPPRTAPAGRVPLPARMRMRQKKDGVGAAELPADATAAQIAAAITKFSGDVKNFAEDVAKKMKTGQEVSDELKVKADKGLTGLEELRQRIDEITQKMARKGNGDPEAEETPGQKLVKHEMLKDLGGNPARFKGRARVEVKAITSLTASAGVLVTPDVRNEIIGPQLRRLTVRDLLPVGRTNSNSIEYIRELLFTNGARVVSETTLKPETALTFEKADAPVRTIAHWLLASKQILADAPRLQTYVDGRLRYGLKYVEEGEILNGDGTGEHLTGIVTVATAYAAPIVIAAATMIDKLRLAHLQAELADFPSTGQVLHPADWAAVELTKDSTGNYIFTNPVAAGGNTLWGRPVVSTQAMQRDKFLVGAFSMGAEIVDREESAVEVSTEDRDNFVKNMVTILNEERIALPIYRPAAFVYGDFGNVT